MTRSKNLFSSSFKDYVCEGDLISAEIDGFDVDARIFYDTDSHVNDADCYGPKQIKRWNNEEWFFCGVAVSVALDGVDLTGAYGAALWACEANISKAGNRHLTDVANELLPEALANARERLAQLAKAYEGMNERNG